MRIANSFVILFLCMMGYLLYYSATHKEELLNNSYNTRQQLLTAQNRRGNIYAAGGQVLAETKETEEGAVRNYPYGSLFAQTVGYITKGKAGIEEQANYYLIQTGASLAEKVQNEALGEKNPGNDVYTTLEVSLQQAADKALGVYKGAIVAMDPDTGKILAMVSKPAYDPNEIAQIWDTLLEDEESGVLLNRVTQGVYPPGSTFKIVTALEYMRENPETWQNYRYNCSGSFRYGEDVINCYHGTNHGNVDLQTSFSKSCNASFANIGIGLDKAAFSDTLDSLLFNKELPLDIRYNQSKIIVKETVGDSDMLQNAIGQGKTQITPMHLCMITAAIANDGELMRPYVIDRVETAAGEKVKQFAPQKAGSLMSAAEAEALKEMMEEVVEHGTGTKLSGLSYTAAGKTGSAEFNKEKGESHAWFTGFAPVENPRLVVTVIIEGAGSGGDYAVPTAKRVFDAWLDR